MGKKIERTCPICKKTYTADETRLKHGRNITCSYSCGRKQTQQKTTKKVKLTCPVCNSTFERSPGHIKKNKHSFCSRDCQYKARTMGISKRTITKPYTYTPESKQAMLEASRKPKGKRKHHWMICTNCGKRFDDPSYGRKRKSGQTFCSLDCCNEFRTGENNPAWRGGHPAYYGKKWKRLRRETRKRDQNTCRRCGILSKSRNHDVHHIKPVSSFEDPDDANYLDNLITLCHPCHQLVEWKGLDFDI